jgi:hypothetical protein
MDIGGGTEPAPFTHHHPATAGSIVDVMLLVRRSIETVRYSSDSWQDRSWGYTNLCAFKVANVSCVYGVIVYILCILTNKFYKKSEKFYTCSINSTSSVYKILISNS